MTSTPEKLREMLKSVAIALGQGQLERMVFVGGCTTALLVTDAFAREQVRFTEDVDLIVYVMGYGEWSLLQEELRRRGFREDHGDDVVCRMRLDGLKVDFMPDDEEILGFTNRWYADSLENWVSYELMDDLFIRVVAPPYFMATKLEAYRGRGNNDPMMSHDIEDIFNIIIGRKEIVDEILVAESNVRDYIREQIRSLMEHPDFASAVAGNSRGAPEWSAYIYSRFEKIISAGS